MNEKKIIIINSHPIQYYAPMYQQMSDTGLNIELWYCDDASVKGAVDKGFGKAVKWDVPLLEGYSYRFFKNQAPSKAVSGGFFNVINLGLLWALLKTPKSIVIINGWQFFTYFFAAFVAKLKGHTLWMRCETPLHLQQKKNGFLQGIKSGFVKHVYFKLFSKFLYIGTQNKNLYLAYNVPEEKLVYSPYAVDNKRFMEQNENLKSQREILRKAKGVEATEKVILFTGKYIWQKNPLDLLEALRHTRTKEVKLLMVGDGPLRNEMEAFIAANKLTNIVLTGFVNQSEIVNYYAIADAFVLCSSSETWGLSVNEAMCFGLPVLVSENCGCALDLVANGQNGFVIPVNQPKQLASYIDQLFEDETRFQKMGQQSFEKIKQQEYAVTINNISEIICQP